MLEYRSQQANIKALRRFDAFDTNLDKSSLDKSSKQTVLVTGGAGYIGSALVDQLLQKGFRVRVLDRFLFGTGSLNFCFQNPDVEIIYSDLQRVREIERHLQGVDAIVHLAGLVGDPACAVSAEFTERSNILTTRNLYRAAKRVKVPRFVFASSCSVYGLSEEVAYEGGPTNPVSLYAETKLASEQDILSDVSEDCCASILRFSTVFGHGYRPRFDLVVNRFVAQAIETGKISVQGGDQFRPFVHVQDIATALMKVIEAPEEKVRSQIFNVGDSRMNYSIQGVAEVIQSMLKDQYPVQIQMDNKVLDRRSYVVSFDKIKDVLGFSYSMSVENGVQEIAQNFQQGFYFPHRHESYHNVDVVKQFIASQESLVRLSA